MAPPKCPICTENYSAQDDEDRIPRILSCFHTICNSCAETIVSREFLKCPFCNKVSHVEDNDVSKLARNFALCQVIEDETNSGPVHIVETPKVVQTQSIESVFEKESTGDFDFQLLNSTSKLEQRKEEFEKQVKALVEVSEKYDEDSSEMNDLKFQISTKFREIKNELDKQEVEITETIMNFLENATVEFMEQKEKKLCEYETFMEFYRKFEKKKEEISTGQQKKELEQMVKQFEMMKPLEPVHLRNPFNIKLDFMLPSLDTPSTGNIIDYEKVLDVYEFGCDWVEMFTKWIFDKCRRVSYKGDNKSYQCDGKWYEVNSPQELNNKDEDTSLTYLIIFISGDKLGQFPNIPRVLKRSAARDILIVRDKDSEDNHGFEKALRNYIDGQKHSFVTLHPFIYVDGEDFEPVLDLLITLN